MVSSASGVPPHGMVGIAMDLGGSQIISGGSTYLIHGGGMEGGRHHASHSSRSSSAMVSTLDELHILCVLVGTYGCSRKNYVSSPVGISVKLL